MKRFLLIGGLILLGTAAVIWGFDYWQQKTQDRSIIGSFTAPYRAEYYLKKLTHPNARVASHAWMALHQLYFTRWSAVDVILQQITDNQPIYFLIEEVANTADPNPKRHRMFMSTGKPIYYKADRIYCRTVGEVLQAMIYQEGSWRTDYEGDWQVWWQKNAGYYGR